MNAVILACSNLFFSQKLSSQLKGLGYPVIVENSLSAIQEKSKDGIFAVIVDLAVRGTDALKLINGIKSDSRTAGVPVIGFCGHADMDRMDAARAAGCDLVTTNGAISSNLAGILEKI